MAPKKKKKEKQAKTTVWNPKFHTFGLYFIYKRKQFKIFIMLLLLLTVTFSLYI